MRLNIALCKFLINQTKEQIIKIIDFLVYIKRYDINLSSLFSNYCDDFVYKDTIQLILSNKLKYEFYNNPLLTIKEYLKFLDNYKEKIEFFKQLVDKLYFLNIEYLYYEESDFINFVIKFPTEEKIFTDGKIYEELFSFSKIRVVEYNWIIKYEREKSIVPGFEINPNRKWKSKCIYITNFDFDLGLLPTYEEVLNKDNIFNNLKKNEKILIIK